MTLKNQVEALLFSSGKAMEEEQLASLTESKQKAVKKALQTLQKEYDNRDTALKLFNEKTTWKLLVRDAYIELVRRIVADTELSKATLETLAVIAYNEPTVLQSKVVEVRGSNAYEQIKELVELGFVVKQKSGRSYSLRLTEKFYDYFDVEGAKSIHHVFKGVKQPPERQRRLGDLDVIDSLPESAVKDANDKKKERVGDLEVVDEKEAPESENFADAPATLEKTPEEEQETSDFLSKIEEQIGNLTQKNDDRDDDEDFKPANRESETSENTQATESMNDEEIDGETETDDIPSDDKEKQ